MSEKEFKSADTKTVEKAIRWNRWYATLVVVLIVQIILYHFITKAYQ